MITSAQNSLLYEIRQTPIPSPTLEEFLARLKHRIHSMILDAFNKSGLSQKELASRLQWDEARVSRCLANSGNYTLKTINALLVAIGVDLDDPTYTSFDILEQRLKTPAPANIVRRSAGRRTRAFFQELQLELNLVAGRRLGANTNPAVSLPFGTVSKPFQPKNQGGKLYQFPVLPKALGQNDHVFLNHGVANAR